MKNKKFKILSIDGGGIRGIIPARILYELEEEIIKKNGPEARLCDYFDLICGTSTGSIIAAGIALGMSAKEILQLYSDNAKAIFPTTSSGKKAIKVLKNDVFYKREELSRLLNGAFGKYSRNNDTRLHDCRTRLCIPTYDLDKGEVHIYKTDHVTNIDRDCHIPVVDAVLSSSAAPVYFYPYTFEYNNIGTDSLNVYKNNVDGGMFANNPTLIGLIEAVCCLDIPIGDIEILSLGTGTINFKEKKNAENLGGLYWLNPSNGSLNIYELMASAQSIFIDNMMKVICHGPGHRNAEAFKYIRIQQVLETKLSLDASDENSIRELQKIGQDLYKKHGEIMKPFLQEKTELFTHKAKI